MSSEAEKGASIFLDVFRRADKNDDGAVSWEEFKSFFADGVLSEEELKILFNEIDTHNTNNIDTEEMCSYFSQHLGPFKHIFSAIEDMNKSVSNALLTSAQNYPKSSDMEQFVTRFLMHEITNQLTSLQRPLDAASDSLEETALAKNDRFGKSATSLTESVRAPLNVQSEKLEDVDPRSLTPGRFARRAKRQLSTQTSWTSESGGSGALVQQVDRLRLIVDRLENKVNFDGITDEEVDAENEKLMVIVHRKLLVDEEHKKSFHSSLRRYVGGLEQIAECQHVNVRSYSNSHLIAVYEIWDSDEAWKTHLKSDVCRTFQHSSIDCLEVPEQVNSLRVPGSWWKRD